MNFNFELQFEFCDSNFFHSKKKFKSGTQNNFSEFAKNKIENRDPKNKMIRLKKMQCAVLILVVVLLLLSAPPCAAAVVLLLLLEAPPKMHSIMVAFDN